MSQYNQTVIQDLRIIPSCTRVRTDEPISLAIRFSIQGGLRDSFNTSTWDKAYDVHDTMIRLKCSIKLQKRKRAFVLRNLVVQKKFIRRATIYLSKDPGDADGQIGSQTKKWILVTNEDDNPRVPTNQEEARSFLFDFTHDIPLIGSDLGMGKHSLSSKVIVKWGTRTYIRGGQASASSKPLEIEIF